MNVVFAPIPGANGRWYDEYLDSPHWHETRAAALARAEHRCQMCNGPERLHVHHRTYERLGQERDADLIVLCHVCHALFHSSGPPLARPAWQKAIRRTVEIDALITVALVFRAAVSYEPYDVSRIRIVFLVGASSDPLTFPPATDFHRDYHYKLHDNGSPWGGSTYRKLVESVYGRRLRKRERVDPQSLVGKPILLDVTAYDNRDWEPKVSFR